MLNVSAHTTNETNARQQQELLPLLFFPCLLLWDELLLRIFSGVGMSMSPLAAALAAAGTGALLSLPVYAVRRRSAQAGLAALVVLAVLTAFCFAVESMIRTVYLTYMTPANLAAGADSVLENYRDEFLRSLLPGTLRFVLLLLPLAAYLAVPASVRRPGRFAPLRIPAVLIAAALLLTGGSALAARTGANAPLYDTQYSYNAAVEAFGLLTASRLDLQYRLFGNDAAGFSDSGEAGDFAGAAQGGTFTDGPDTVPGPGTDGFAAGNTGEADLSGSPADAQALLPATGSDAQALPGHPDSRTPGTDAGGQDSPDETQAASAGPAAAPRPYGFNVMAIDFLSEELNGSKKTQQLSAYLRTRMPSRKNAFTGLFKGKNLILVCAEAYCDRFITPELTPTLWRLTHNGFYFEEYYQSEWGGSTTTGEMAFLTGLGGNNGDESLSGIAGNNHYFTMGNQLQRLGYSSIAFHSGSHTYYKRHTTHENLGYDTFLASGNGLQKRIGYSYAPDTVLVDATTDLYLGHAPFSVYYMTISGHAPYVRKNPLVSKYYDRVNEAVGDEYAEKTKYYICYQMELEEAMKLLVERLEEAGIADDTVIVLTGDHYPYGLGGGSTWQNDRDYIKDLLHGSDYYRWEQDRSGLIIWCGSLEHADRDMARTVSDPVGNLDILPTLSNLFGLEFDSRLLPGRDVLDPETQPLVVWNNLSFVTREGKYDGRKGGWHPNEGFEWTETDPDYLPRMHSLVNDRLLMSRLIAQTDYYGLPCGRRICLPA